MVVSSAALLPDGQIRRSCILASALPCGVVRCISLASEGRQHEGRSFVGLVVSRRAAHLSSPFVFRRGAARL